MHFIILLLTLVQAQTAAPTAELTCGLVLPVQERFLTSHLTQVQLSNELEKRTIDQFMKRLDGSRLYLLDGDYKEVAQSVQKIFTKIRAGDCSPIFKANEIYVKRAEERVAFANEYLGPKFKISRELKYQADAEKRTRAKTSAEANQKFMTQLQFEVANFVATDIGLEEAKKHVLKGYERFLKHVHKLKPRDVLGSYLDTFASALDPHTNYMPAEVNEDFEISMKLALEGIGASLGWKNGFTTVEQLLPGGAALSTGLVKRKDKIIGVAQGKDGPFTDVIEMELRDVIKLIRGPKGTLVRLKLLRREKGQNQRLEVSLNRAKITLEEQAAFISYFDQDVSGRKIKVGMLNLPSFYDDQTKDGKSATNDLKRLIAEAVKNKADALVLDLSNNGGGSLSDAVEVAGLFFATGGVVRVGGRAALANEKDQKAYQTLEDQDPHVQWPGPLVVLTNRASASASEIVSGALQDYRRAVVVGGDHTYGKGTVQTIEQLTPGLGAIKTTIGMFFTAGGFTTQYRGVPGDIVLPSVLAQDQYSEKKLDYSLPPKKIDSFISSSAYTLIGPDQWHVVNKEMIDHLKQKSNTRVEASKDFKKVLADLAKAKKKPETLMSIAAILKGKDPNATKAEEDEDKDTPSPTREERIKEYLKRAEIIEAVNIASDLVIELTPRDQPRTPSGSPK